jgi:hypothetical protein
MDIASQSLRDDGDEAKLQESAPFERPEQKIPSTLNRERNRIDSGYIAHIRPFREAFP